MLGTVVGKEEFCAAARGANEIIAAEKREVTAKSENGLRMNASESRHLKLNGRARRGMIQQSQLRAEVFLFFSPDRPLRRQLAIR